MKYIGVDFGGKYSLPETSSWETSSPTNKISIFVGCLGEDLGINSSIIPSIILLSKIYHFFKLIFIFIFPPVFIDLCFVGCWYLFKNWFIFQYSFPPSRFQRRLSLFYTFFYAFQTFSLSFCWYSDNCGYILLFWIICPKGCLCWLL